MNNFIGKEALKKARKSVKVLLFTVLFVLMLLFFRFVFITNSNVSNPQFTNGDLEVYMLDVGQGDCFVFLQNDKVMVVDCGTNTCYKKATQTLKELGVKKVDYIVITHFHQDHSAGLFRILHNYRVDKVIITDMSTMRLPFMQHRFYYAINAYLSFKDLCYKGDLVSFAKQDNQSFRNFDFSNSKVKFYAPIKDTYDNFNNYSLVMKITYKDVSILMTGDIEYEAEEDLVERYGKTNELKADIYKAAHHGSYTSNSEDFMRMVDPEVVLLSSHNGENNEYGHPVQSFVSYLKKNHITLFRTDEQGDVMLQIDGKNILVDRFPADYLSGKNFERSVK